VIQPSGRVEPEKRIGEYVYRCVPLRGEDVIDVMVLVCRALSPIASEDLVGSLLSGKPVQGDSAVASLGGSLSLVLRELRSEDVQDLRKRLAAVTLVQRDGQWLPLKDVFGEHFAGRPAEILQWMLHAFSVSFPLFFLGSPSSPDPAAGA
jgi:hypothetical protein